ncbi:MAG: fumarate hydratase, partial [Alphaproteobacteria bacterium]|nr:fumarate hydratase [Alphaproteobacteria bacterium]
MTPFAYQDLFPLGEDKTPYRKLESDSADGLVGTAEFQGQEILTVNPEALTWMTREAMRDIAHLLRPSHLGQLRAILEDPEASENDRFVAMELLQNANVAA